MSGKQVVTIRRTEISARLASLFSDEELTRAINKTLHEELCTRAAHSIQGMLYYPNDMAKISMAKEALSIMVAYLDERLVESVQHD